MIFLGLTVGFAFGFLWGRKRGLQEGFNRGLAFRPLERRRELWRQETGE